MLKFKIDSAAFDALDDAVKGLYNKSGDDYVLAVEGLEDVSGLKSQVAALLNEKKTEAEKRRAAEEAEKQAREEAARKAGDVEALDKSWQEKLAKVQAEASGRTELLSKKVQDLTIGATARDLASRVFGKNAGLMLPHVAPRLSLEEVDGDFKVRVMKDGKPSAMSLDDLEKEFRTNADYAAVVVASGAGGTPKGGFQPAGGGAMPQSTLAQRATEIASGIGE
ncbi:hypothetical protein O197_45 [Edwardsiella phage eiAU-183]|uniref:Uncharacterized protein n=3 Tax=Viruses TaxID=10239 RepID=W0LI75_9CAUD|nr:head scaffolding protein [Edwardsiella phage eiAU-183]YP_009613895.1 head scaffolding protein [Edwardsiella phage eiAU]ADV36480.1 hypothetical protein [Edwardsiella phage eiDWF]AHG23461.1 hypothetical protein P858_45 [Edwardsiella phage eiAU]AHG23515.1 hypothetical protein O197_45 [Edwardsiella phage eiAU-183]